MSPQRSPERLRAERQGRRGEALAAWYLRLKGWRILDRRVKTRRGEIDIVARRGGIVAYVEVKWRKTVAERDRAIDAHRLRRVADAVAIVAQRYEKPGDSVRIDVLLLAPGYWPRVIENAWMPLS